MYSGCWVAFGVNSARFLSVNGEVMISLFHRLLYPDLVKSN